MSSRLRELESAFSRSPSLESCLELGRYYLDHAQLMQAMVVCKKGLKLSSEHPKAQALLAEIYLGQGKEAKALELAESILKDNSCAEAVALVGKMLQAQGDEAGGVQAYNRALELDASCEIALDGVQRLQPNAPQPEPGENFANQAAPQEAPSPIAPLIPDEPALTDTPHSGTFTTINDVFADDNLGFDDLEPYEMKLSTGKHSTILGFVPGQKGSLRNSLLVALSLVLATGAFVYWLWAGAKHSQEIAMISQAMIEAVEKDSFSGYQEVLVLGNQIEVLEPNNPLGKSLLAYTQAVLGLEHGVEGASERAEKLVDTLPVEAHKTSYAQSARAQLARNAGKDEAVWSEWGSKLKEGGLDPRMVLEAFFAKSKLDPSGTETLALRARLIESLSVQTRAQHLMGWYFFKAGDWIRALASFDKALNNNHNHLGAMLGRGFTLMSTKSIGAKVEIQAILDEVAKRKPELESAYYAELYRWLKAEHARFGANKEAIVQAKKERQELLVQSRRGLFAYREGRIQAEANDASRAVEQFQQAVLSEPTSVEYVLSWVQVLMLQKKFDAALDALKAARQNGLKEPVLELATVELQLKAKKSVEWSRVERVQRVHGATLFAKAQYYKAMGMRLNSEPVKAGLLLEGYLDGMPSSVIAKEQASLWCELGNTYWETNRKEEAVAAYQLGLDVSPQNSECSRQLCARGAGTLKDKACRLRR